jgi:alkaline phosphatase D
MLSVLAGCAGEVAEVVPVDASLWVDVLAPQGDTPAATDAVARPDVADVPVVDIPGMDIPGMDASVRDVVDASVRDVVDASVRDVVDASDVPVDADPPPPTFPARIGHLTFAIRTGSGANDGTDTNTLSLCLNETRCFPMNVADVNDFRRGEMDVYHFEGVDLPRSAVDRVEIRSANGSDAWRPTCVEMQWDGEPVHCADGLTGLFGNAPGELSRWRDPAGVHRGCVSCYPDLVTHGPVVGAVTPSSARVMVRSDATRQLVLRVLDDARPDARPLRLVQYPLPGDDYTRRFDVTGLEPAHGYTALVEVDGRLSAARARFRTAPADGVAGALRIALGSCARDDAQPIFATVAAQRPDLFVWVGDNHYGNTGDLGSLWWFYRRALEVPERGALLAGLSGLAVWDDHDYVGNNTDRTSPGRAQALRAFEDYQPNGTYGQPGDPGVYFRARWGDVDVFMLDVRYGRDTPGPTSARIMTEAQTAWLEAELMRSTATFKLIASGTNFSAGAGESWAQYPASRDRLFSFLAANRIGGVVLLSGDIHRSHLRRIRRANGYELPEVVSSPLANVTTTCPTTAPDATQVACYAAGPSLVTLEVDTRATDPRLLARILDVDGIERGRMEVLRSSLR